MSARLWLGFIATFALLSQLQVFGNPIWQSSDDEGEKTTKDGFPCSSQADCLSGECCLVNGGDSDQQGVCKKLGTIGSRCSVVSSQDQQSIQAEYCPCVKELECLASSETCRENVGVFDRLLNIFSPNDEDDNKDSDNGYQQPQQRNEEEEEEQEVEVQEEEAQEQEQEQEQEQDQEQEQEQEAQQQEEQEEENEETDTQDEDGEDKRETEHGFWSFG